MVTITTPTTINQQQTKPGSLKVLIRCDAAPAIGFGHVVRCLALADALRDGHGCEVSFAMLQGPKGYEQVRANGYVVYQFPSSPAPLDEGKWLKELIVNNQQQVLILDVLSDLATSAIHAIRATGVFIATIDDPSDRRLFADLAFYPPVPQVGRLDWPGFTGQRFVGWDWVMLRPQFAKYAQRARAREPDSKSGLSSTNRRLTILVTMGGSDPAGLTLMALDAVERIDSDFRTLVVIGSAFMHDAALADWLASAKRAYQICRNVADMASLMTEADLAVSSFGVTAYELAAMGVPTIYLCLSHDHAESCEAFVAGKMAFSLGHYHDVKTEKLSKSIDTLLMNSVKRRSMAERCIRSVDGLGAERVAEQIAKLRSS